MQVLFFARDESFAITPKRNAKKVKMQADRWHLIREETLSGLAQSFRLPENSILEAIKSGGSYIFAWK